MTTIVPANDQRAEAAVLSAIMLQPELLDDVRDLIQPDSFYLPAHRIIYSAILSCDQASEAIDAVTLARALRSQKNLTSVGGTPYLAELTDSTPAIAHIESHASIIAEKHRQRRMVDILRNLSAEGQQVETGVSEWIQRVESDIFRASDQGSTVAKLETVGQVAGHVMMESKRREEGEFTPHGVSSGFAGLDKVIGGLANSSLYILAARPGMGKSALALAISHRVALDRKKVVVFISLEMPCDQIAARALSSASRVPVERILKREIGEGDWQAVTQAAGEINALNLVVDYKPGATVPEVRSVVRRAVRGQRALHGDDLELGLVVVDYIQIMTGQRQRGDSRETEIASISRDLMRMAGEMNVPVLALSQLNRAVESRDDKRPQMRDLRESGAIEQDAYCIMFIYREEFYKKDTQDKGVAEVIVAKNRNGSTGTANLTFAGEYTRFDDLKAEADPFDDFGQSWNDSAEGEF